MKRLKFNRTQLLHAIRAACIALFLLGAPHKASAQQSTVPFVISGTTVTTSPAGTYPSPVGFYDTGNTYTSFTVSSGVVINSTSAYGENVANPAVNQTVILATTGTFTNAGSINLNTSSGFYNNTVTLNQGTVPVTISNTGTITSSGASNLNEGQALIVNSTSGSITGDNQGVISTSNGNYAITVNLNSNSGSITFTNELSGQITNNVNGSALLVQTAGAVSLTNDGAISSGGGAMYADSYGSGPVEVINHGTITSGNFSSAAEAFAFNGPATAINTGTITGMNSSYGMDAGASNGNAPVIVNNSGEISGVSTSLSGYNHGTGTLTITNTGTLTSSNSGIYAYGSGVASAEIVHNSGSITAGSIGITSPYAPATVVDSGAITAPTAISVESGSSVTLQGRPAISGTIVGGATSSSTSQLVFDLAIPAANLAAARAQLSSEIMTYNAQLGGDMTFTVDGLVYDISNFDYSTITDDLTSSGGSPARRYAATPGYGSLGAALDNLNPANAVASRILAALNNVPDAGVANALAELSPKSLEIFRNVAFDNNTFNTGQINNHLANLRDGLTGFDSSELTLQEPGTDSQLDQVRNHLLAFNPPASDGVISDSPGLLFGGVDTKNMEVKTEPADRWSSFIAGNVILADLNHNSTLQDSDYTTGAVTGGVDYRLDDHFTVGALFAYAHTSADLDQRSSSATVDSYSPGLYASYVDRGWYGNFLGAYTRNSYTEDRVTDIAGLNGDNHGGTSGNQGSANLTGGYEFQHGAFKFGPVASLEYVHLAIESLREQGPVALDINSQDQDSLRSLIGLEGRFTTVVKSCLGPVNLTPHVSASWQHEYLDNSQGITSQFDGTGGGSFSVQTDTPGRDSAFIDAGFDATVNQNVTVFVDYQVQAGQNDFFAQSAQAGVKIGF